MPESPYQILTICSHPVQYMSPLLRHLAQCPQVNLHVAYCSLRGAEVTYDPDFTTAVKWDVPLLDGYNWHEIANLGSGSEGFWGLCNPGLWQLIRRGHFDAVVCHTGYLKASFWIACLAARSSGAAFLFGTDATSLTPRDSRSWKVAIKRALWPYLYSLADQIIVPSTGTKALIESLGISKDRITLTPYSVDNDWWVARSVEVERARVRSKWAVDDGSLVVLFCAKLQPWKRPGDLLEAFAAANVTNAILVFAGDGPLRQDLAVRAAELAVGDKVRFLGFVNQSALPDIYTASDLLVLPSEYEPFGVVVNEASCCGCPVAGSDRVGAARDLIAPVNPELVFPHGDIPALTELLRKTLSDRALLARRGRAARRRMETWSFKENIEGVLEAVRRATAKSDTN